MKELQRILEQELNLEMAEVIEQDSDGYHFEAFRIAENPINDEPYEYVDLYVSLMGKVYLNGVQQDIYLPIDVWALQYQ